MRSNGQVITKQTIYSVGELYDKYAAMLLGYIVELVRDQKVAEQQLVAIFSDLPAYLHEINKNGSNAWCQLQRLAKIKLVEAGCGIVADAKLTGINLTTANARDKFLNLMSDEQRYIFSEVYSRGKNIAQLSAETGQTQELICKTLKEAFAVIKKAQ